MLMYQSIPPAVHCDSPPPPSRSTFACLVSPGGEVLANLAQSGGRALANSGSTEKFVYVSKGMFSLFEGANGGTQLSVNYYFFGQLSVNY